MSSPSASSDSITAAVLVIGDEILSGRTKDVNIGTIADFCTDLGIELSEVRVVPDIENEIIAAVNALRVRYTYVFTTGGIGPTHDDITADAIAKAFGVALPINPEARAMLEARWRETGTVVNEARLRMARIPEGASLIVNSVSAAPGFRIENVHVMAGVPSIMQAMLDSIAPTLKGAAAMLSETIEAAGLPEGSYASGLGEIAKARPAVSIGSYPAMTPEGFRNRIVVSSRDAQALAEARSAVEALMARLSA